MTSRLTGVQRSRMAEALTLSRFLIAESSTADESLVQRRRDRLRTLQQELQACTHPIRRDLCAPESIPLGVRQAFVQSTLLVSRYFAVGGVGWRGTFESPTLAGYRPDPTPPVWETTTGIAVMGDRFALPKEVMEDIAHTLKQVDTEIAQQRQLINAVLQSVGLAADMPEPLPIDPFALLFQNLFNGVVVNADRLSVIFTPTQLHFCIDFPPLEDFLAWGNLSAPEYQADLRDLHQKLSDFSFQKFKRFPTFGPCDPAGINWEWAQTVCDRFKDQSPSLSSVTPEQVIQRLSKSIGVLPAKDAEMFLVHDIWGHYWQLLFSQFDSDYVTLADCGEALRLQETAYTPQGPLTFRELFQFSNADVLVDEGRARQFFHGEVRQRLGLLFTHLLGELVADIAEFKFTWTNPESAHQLPSSSAFTDYPANLDLSLADLDFLFLRVLQPLLEIHLSPLKTSPLEIALLTESSIQQLSSDQVPRLEVNLKRAIAQLYQIFIDEYYTAYLPVIETEESLFAEIALNLLQLQNVINTLYTDAQFTEQAPLPFQDLLIVFVSNYCSGDSYAEFWKIDNVLAEYFIPCWRLLLQTI
ncbi:hypothetical protein PN498_12930 [Oscillatoria sp. CS-180]|uniref:hypothetical protein n=1 Tax=Oscillatoria sp. CS-180 TaxID=3021720 RepID=UPI00232F5CFB|nr:hypothetical protein [Oscillatoria sp. CS-180]MDB9526896.1 hypothetical protein [Oscillatoria sp. CS-180]